MKEILLQDTQIRNIHELGEIKRAQELRVDEISAQKFREGTTRYRDTLFTIAVYARINEFCERFR